MRITLLSPDPAALRDFYRRVFDAHLWELGVSLGDERIEIAPCTDPRPETFAGNETGFQHFAIVVADIGAAYAHLQDFAGWRPLSLDGPEQLPKASGGAAAFKFRDPDGHPLELLQFAGDSVAPLWRARFAASPRLMFHGVDHSALTVRDTEASVAFYAKLGFACVHRQINMGVQQARLDGLAGAQDATVAIASLSPADGARPGIELLEYRQPPTVVGAASDGATAATSLVLDGAEGGPAADLDGHRLAYAEFPRD